MVLGRHRRRSGPRAWPGCPPRRRRAHAERLAIAAHIGARRPSASRPARCRRGRRCSWPRSAASADAGWRRICSARRLGQLQVDLPAAVDAVRPARPHGAGRARPPRQRIELAQLRRRRPGARRVGCRRAAAAPSAWPCALAVARAWRAAGSAPARRRSAVSLNCACSGLAEAASVPSSAPSIRACQRAALAGALAAGALAAARRGQRHAAQLQVDARRRRAAAARRRAGEPARRRPAAIAAAASLPAHWPRPCTRPGGLAVVGEQRVELPDLDAIEPVRRAAEFELHLAHRHAAVVPAPGFVVAHVHRGLRRAVEAGALHVGLRVDAGARRRAAERRQVERARRQLQRRQRPGGERLRCAPARPASARWRCVRRRAGWRAGEVAPAGRRH